MPLPPKKVRGVWKVHRMLLPMQEGEEGAGGPYTRAQEEEEGASRNDGRGKVGRPAEQGGRD